MKLKSKLYTILTLFLTVALVALGMFTVSKRALQCFSVKDNATLMAAYLMMPNGEFEKESTPEKTSDDTLSKKALDNKSSVAKTEKADEDLSFTNEETFPIEEVNLNSDNKLFDNVTLKNTTSYTVDVKERLSRTLPFEINDTRQAQVLIVHTHSCESYMDEDCGFYYESFYPRTTDNEKNVNAVGEALAKSLKEKNIGVVHATTQHDYPSYDGAYSRSYDTIMSYLEKYEGIKVVLDIHRDSMTTDSLSRLKPTFYYNGKKGAQIMIMSGYDSSYTYFPTWEDNLTFALKLQNTCESMYPGMTRPLSFGDFTYNMNVNSGSLLIEVGTDANTLEEAVFSGELLGNALAQVLQ